MSTVIAGNTELLFMDHPLSTKCSLQVTNRTAEKFPLFLGNARPGLLPWRPAKRTPSPVCAWVPSRLTDSTGRVGARAPRSVCEELSRRPHQEVRNHEAPDVRSLGVF